MEENKKENHLDAAKATMAGVGGIFGKSAHNKCIMCSEFILCNEEEYFFSSHPICKSCHTKLTHVRSIRPIEPTSDPFHGNIDSNQEIRDELKKIQVKAQAIKNDQGKERWDLMPFDALREIAKVFTQGAKKYSDRNWENGLDYSRPYSALQRHLSAWWEDREENDSEWGLSHLAHAGCCLLMLLSYQLRNRNRDKSKFDNRPTHGPS